MNKILFVLVCLITTSFSFASGVDLHAHLFMDEGVNIIYRGNFHDKKIKAKKWSHAKRSQVNEELLQQTDLSIVVASLYAAPIIAGERVYRSIHKQIDTAEAFVAANPDWIIAGSSTEARDALANGKKVMVLSVEGGDRIVNTLEQVKALHERKVRIITLLHLTSDRLGSPAFLSLSESFFSQFYESLFCYQRDPNGVKINCNGLTKNGSIVSDMLMDAGIWIDLSHSSDRALETLIPKHYARNVPLLYTHASLRSKLGLERGVTPEVLAHFRKLGGMFGLVPSKKFLGKTKACAGTVDALAEHYEILANLISPEQIALGTDTNGMIDHIRPRNPRETCNEQGLYTEFDRQGGWWNFLHTGPLWKELKSVNSKVSEPEEVVERFLQEWEKVEAAAVPTHIWGPLSPYQDLKR